MVKKRSSGLGNVFLWSMIIFFVISGLVGASFLLLGSFDSIQLNILLTTLTLGFFSLLGLGNVRALNSKGFIKSLSLGGIVLSAVASFLLILVIWDVIRIDDIFGKLIFTFSLLAFSVSHVSLLYDKKKGLGRIFMYATYVLIVVVDLIFLYVIWGQNSGETILRVLGFFVILDVVGSIITPLSRGLGR